jgi:hypothetical protein
VEAWYHRNVLRELGRSKMTLSVSGGAVGTFWLEMVVSGLRFSVHIPVCLQRSDSRTGGFVAVTVVVLSS